jgi:hypothetical protein
MIYRVVIFGGSKSSYIFCETQPSREMPVLASISRVSSLQAPRFTQLGPVSKDHPSTKANSRDETGNEENKEQAQI